VSQYDPAFALLFAIHLVVIATLWLRRRRGYYALLCLLFALLTAAFLVRWLVPHQRAWGLALHLWLRYAAWTVAAVTAPWTAIRLANRLRRQVGGGRAGVD
jgi:hypothetical protein